MIAHVIIEGNIMRKIFKGLFPDEKITVFNREFESKYILWLLLAIGIILRIVLLGIVPGGINQDEAFSGYEAYSLVNYGIDSSGYAFPVYFVSWGSGMNVLNSYLMMPFIALFGVSAWTIRLPQVLVACVSLYVFYRLFREFVGEKISLVALAALVICPWHIMMSRWGLESNLAPGFLLFGLYAFLLGTKKPKYYIVSAVCYGLSLYCYATIWVVVPFLILLQFLYLLWVKKIRFSLELVIAVLVLAFLAMPLIAFLLVNNGYMDEIKTGFFSIPKLVYMRDSEISFANISDNFKNLCNLLWTQNDELIWNTTKQFGLYYKGGVVVAIIGLIYSVYRTVLSIVKRKFDAHAVIFINFVVSFALGCLVYVNVNRINCIHLSIVAFIAIAIYQGGKLAYKMTKYGDYVTSVISVVALISVVLFSQYYFGDYKSEIAPVFQEGLDEAIEFADSVANENQVIYVSPVYSYSKILLLDKYPVKEYINTVNYSNYPSAYLSVSSFGNYNFEFSYVDEANIYIVDKSTGETFIEYGYAVDIFDEVAVIHGANYSNRLYE